MEKGVSVPEDVTEAMDLVCAELEEELDPFVSAAARLVLERSEWYRDSLCSVVLIRGHVIFSRGLTPMNTDKASRTALRGPGYIGCR